MSLIYLAEDDRSLRAVLLESLRREGYDVRAFENGAELVRAQRERSADALVLDVMMPVMDGFQALEAVRSFSDVPVLLLTARSSDEDHCAGLDAGTDDFLGKPFSMAVLLAHLKALLRRSAAGSVSGRELSWGNVAFDPSRDEATVAGRPVRLTPTEKLLLAFFLSRPDQALAREEIANAVWGAPDAIERRSVDEACRRLRNKLLACGADAFNETLWGHGFRFTRKEGS